jgi:Putative DNA-binding domain
VKPSPPPATLSDAQRWLAQLVLAGTSAVPESIADAQSRLVGVSRRDADARLRAYVGGYPARIREALAEAYPAIQRVVGDYEFAQLAARYAPAAPAGQYSLNAAAADLGSFLRTDPLSDALPFLPDLAVLEWRVLEAFHARDEPSADLQAMALWDMDTWAAAVFAFKPSLAVVTSEWPVHDLWMARETPRAEIDILVEDRPQAAVVYRYGDWDAIEAVVRCEVVTPGCAAALSLLVAGASMGEVMADLAAAGEAPDSVGGWFADWAAAGIVCRVG